MIFPDLKKIPKDFMFFSKEQDTNYLEKIVLIIFENWKRFIIKIYLTFIGKIDFLRILTGENFCSRKKKEVYKMKNVRVVFEQI